MELWDEVWRGGRRRDYLREEGMLDSGVACRLWDCDWWLFFFLGLFKTVQKIESGGQRKSLCLYMD